MKIFWSWQADTPGKTGRHLVRDALREAINRLKETEEVSEPIREELHLDQDIQDTSGSPDLARTIFTKIDNSRVIVADVTCTGEIAEDLRKDGLPPKKFINSNVAIELGYALRAISDERVLLVFNKHYSSHEDLPFDLRHKGGAITFQLSPTATSAQIAAEKKNLTATFVERLKPYLKEPSSRREQFVETPSTFNKAVYFEPGESLVQLGPNETFRYSGELPFCYFRIIPTIHLKDSLLIANLRDVAVEMPLLSTGWGTDSPIHNKYGAIAFHERSNNTLISSTQFFENGEIWGITDDLLVGKPSERLRILHSLALERSYNETLPAVIKVAQKALGLKMPIQVELGVTGIKDMDLAIWQKSPSPYEYAIHKDHVVRRELLADAALLDKVLLEFFTRIYDAAGQRRPTGGHYKAM